MIEQFIQFIELIISHFGSLGVFIAAIAEEIIAPIPSGLVMMSSGYAFLSGSPISLSSLLYLIVSVVIPLSLGLTLGSFIVYGLSYHYGEILIKKFGKYIQVSWNDVMKIHRHFERGYKDELVLFILRIIPIIPSIAINAVSGIIKIPWKEYAIVTFAGVFIRSLILSFAGWQLGNIYKEYAVQIDHFENYVFYTIIALVIAFVIWKRWGKKTIS